MSLLSKSEKEYISQGIMEDMRLDGRGRLDYRPFQLSLNPIPQAIGSARLKMGFGGDFLVAVKGEITRPDPDTPTQGFMTFSVDSSSSVLKEGDEKATMDRNTLTAATLQHILAESFDLTQLCIVPGRHCWSLFVDVLVLESDGNILDAAVMASRAALNATRLPGVSVETDTEAESLALSDDPNDARVLSCQNLPLTVTLCQIDATAYFVDPTRAEESCVRALLSVAMNQTGAVTFLQKSAAGAIEPSILADMLGVAQATAHSLFSQFHGQSVNA